MVEKKKVRILIVLTIIFLLLFKLILTYRPPISGTVIDSVTGKPIPNIRVDRFIELVVPSFHTSTYTTKKYNTYTDDDGTFEFGSIWIFNPPVVAFGEEWANANVDFSDKKINPINRKYNMVGFSNGWGGVIRRLSYNGQPYEIVISPVVGNLSECRGEPLCIEENSFAIALKTGNSNLCNNLNQLIRTTTRTDLCRNILGITQDNASLCKSGGNYQHYCGRYLGNVDKSGICGLVLNAYHRDVCLETVNK